MLVTVFGHCIGVMARHPAVIKFPQIGSLLGALDRDVDAAHMERAAAGQLLVGATLVHLESFEDLKADGKTGVEVGHRLLEDHHRH